MSSLVNITDEQLQAQQRRKARERIAATFEIAGLS
jgi:hypothetical protein